MDQGDAELLQKLCPDIYSNEWQHNKVVIRDYLKKLGSYKYEDLLKEPIRLKEEKSIILEQTQELAITNYRTFIETGQCSRDVFAQFNTIESKLDKLLVDLPDFETKCNEFVEQTKDINDLRRLNSLTLTKSAQLLEILEMPQLMNSFIADGLYEDALELAGYVRKLYNKHPDIPIFKSIVNDVEQAWLLMLHQLVNQLKSDLTLPKCLQIVGYLRRMEVFYEAELRLKFLQTRNVWLQTSLNSIPKDDATFHLTKTIEMTRVNLFNIITQYRAIFNDDEHGPLSTTLTEDQINPNVIFFTWIRDKIDEFLKVLEHDLSRGVPVESVLAQCMFFGVSFSKVGCDFRSKLVPIFTQKIEENFQLSLTKAMNNLEKNMERFTLINKNHPNVPWKSKTDDAIQPPESLLEFYPLAEFLNNCLTAFNELKLCAPIASISLIMKILQESLVRIAKLILVLHGQEQQAFTQNSKDAFIRLCMCFADDLVPYLQKCIHIIYPPSNIAGILGVGVQTLQNQHITFFDRAKIIEPIKHLLPAKVDLWENTENDSAPKNQEIKEKNTDVSSTQNESDIKSEFVKENTETSN